MYFVSYLVTFCSASIYGPDGWFVDWSMVRKGGLVDGICASFQP